MPNISGVCILVASSLIMGLNGCSSQTQHISHRTQGKDTVAPKEIKSLSLNSHEQAIEDAAKLVIRIMESNSCTGLQTAVDNLFHLTAGYTQMSCKSVDLVRAANRASKGVVPRFSCTSGGCAAGIAGAAFGAITLCIGTDATAQAKEPDSCFMARDSMMVAATSLFAFYSDYKRAYRAWCERTDSVDEVHRIDGEIQSARSQFESAKNHYMSILPKCERAETEAAALDGQHDAELAARSALDCNAFEEEICKFIKIEPIVEDMGTLDASGE